MAMVPMLLLLMVRRLLLLMVLMIVVLTLFPLVLPHCLLPVPRMHGSLLTLPLQLHLVTAFLVDLFLSLGFPLSLLLFTFLLLRGFTFFFFGVPRARISAIHLLEFVGALRRRPLVIALALACFPR